MWGCAQRADVACSVGRADRSCRGQREHGSAADAGHLATEPRPAVPGPGCGIVLGQTDRASYVRATCGSRGGPSRRARSALARCERAGVPAIRWVGLIARVDQLEADLHDLQHDSMSNPAVGMPPRISPRMDGGSSSSHRRQRLAPPLREVGYGSRFDCLRRDARPEPVAIDQPERVTRKSREPVLTPTRLAQSANDYPASRRAEIARSAHRETSLPLGRPEKSNGVQRASETSRFGRS